MVAMQLGFSQWHPVDKLLKKLKTDQGFDIKASDNSYHAAVRTGTNGGSVTHKYSDDFVTLLRSIIDEKPFNLKGISTIDLKPDPITV